MRIVGQAIQEAYKAGYLGKKTFLARALITTWMLRRCRRLTFAAEETGMISSLEGTQRATELKPPISGRAGYLRKPTIVNNVETLAAVKYIIRDGAAAYRKHGTEKSAGTKLFSVSGNVQRPGTYEVPLGLPLRVLINDLCGGMKPGRKLKPLFRGQSAPVLTADEAMKVTMDYEAHAQMGSMLGSGAVIVMDDSNCMVDMLGVIMHFYHHGVLRAVHALP